MQNPQNKLNFFEQGLQRYLSKAQLNKIQQKKIGIGGAGGLGSNIAMILTRCGFKHFMIIDQDQIDSSNLNRQQFFIQDIGLNKVATLKKRLLQINPDAHITTFHTTWTVSQGKKYFKTYDFIIEAFDSAQNKHQFVEYYQGKAPHLISGNGMAGLIEKKPIKIKKMDNIYLVGDFSTDTQQGHPPLAPRVTLCAAIMAEIVLDLTLGKKILLSSFP